MRNFVGNVSDLAFAVYVEYSDTNDCSLDWKQKYDMMLQWEAALFEVYPPLCHANVGTVTGARAFGDYHYRRFLMLYAIFIPCMNAGKIRTTTVYDDLMEILFLRFPHFRSSHPSHRDTIVKTKPGKDVPPGKISLSKYERVSGIRCESSLPYSTPSVARVSANTATPSLVA